LKKRMTNKKEEDNPLSNHHWSMPDLRNANPS
jgi:hypothetical protein